MSGALIFLLIFLYTSDSIPACRELAQNKQRICFYLKSLLSVFSCCCYLFLSIFVSYDCALQFRHKTKSCNNIAYEWLNGSDIFLTEFSMDFVIMTAKKQKSWQKKKHKIWVCSAWHGKYVWWVQCWIIDFIRIITIAESISFTHTKINSYWFACRRNMANFVYSSSSGQTIQFAHARFGKIQMHGIEHWAHSKQCIGEEQAHGTSRVLFCISLMMHCAHKQQTINHLSIAQWIRKKENKSQENC